MTYSLSRWDKICEALSSSEEADEDRVNAGDVRETIAQLKGGKISPWAALQKYATDDPQCSGAEEAFRRAAAAGGPSGEEAPTPPRLRDSANAVRMNNVPHPAYKLLGKPLDDPAVVAFVEEAVEVRRLAVLESKKAGGDVVEAEARTEQVYEK